MDWSKSTWTLEDALYAPKRKVNNKGSRNRPHLIGSMYSNKMGREVEYESLGEYLFYSILELDKTARRYYVQPVEIQIPFLLPNGRRDHWLHVPDVLVFRQGNIPHLYQVKEASDQISEKDARINRYCHQYAKEQQWKYSVIHSKSIPPIV